MKKLDKTELPVKITKIDIEISGNTLSLTLEEAEELHKALKRLFEPETVYIPYSVPVLEKYPSRPWLPPYEVTWTSTAKGQEL